LYHQHSLYKHLQNSISQGYVSQGSTHSYSTPSVSSKSQAPQAPQTQTLSPPQANYDQRNNVSTTPMNSRRSSLTASVSNAQLSTSTASNSRQGPAHLNQTENLVIQPQSLAIITEHYSNLTPQPTTQPSSAMDIILTDEMVTFFKQIFKIYFL